jgi:hypothetical protein
MIGSESVQSTSRSLSVADVYQKLLAVPAAFPDLRACFRLAMTLPVASATAERSFSTMQRIKTHLRASMSDGRLSNIALIAVERELSGELMKDPTKVIDAFATTAGKRRLDLLL